MKLTSIELVIVRAASEAEEFGNDAHQAAWKAAQQEVDKPGFDLALRRLHDGGLIQARVLRGDDGMAAVHLLKVLPAGLDAARS